MEVIHITMSPIEKQNFYAEKFRLIENNPPVTDEEKADALNTISLLVNEPEENISYINKVYYFQIFIAAISTNIFDKFNEFGEFRNESRD